MKIDDKHYHDAKNSLLKLLKEWDRAGWDVPKYDVKTRGEEFDGWLDNLKNKGWKRKNVYDLVWDIMNNYEKELTQKSVYVLENFETSLTGHCTREGFERFPGEPEDEIAFVDYVYGKSWLYIAH